MAFDGRVQSKKLTGWELIGIYIYAQNIQRINCGENGTLAQYGALTYKTGELLKHT